MHKSTSLMVLASLMFAGPALAKDGDKKEERHIVIKRFDGGMEGFDANKDGKVTKKEFEKGVAAHTQDRFKSLDADGDGVLSADEQSSPKRRMMRAPHLMMDLEGMDADLDAALAEVDKALAEADVEIKKAMENSGRGMGKHREVMMKEMDENADGKISKEEFMKRPDRHFDELDKNNDGTLSADEMTDMKAMGRRHRVIVKTNDGKK